MKIESNIYWDASGSPATFEGMDFASWQKTGKDAGSLVADPLFVSPDQLDFHLKPDSPAKSNRFRAFRLLSRAGVYGDPAWMRLARSATYQPVAAPPPPPPLVLAEDFENQPVGAVPRFATVYVEGKGDSISVTDEAADTGNHSLKVVDVPGLAESYNPHFFYEPGYTEGVARCAFDLRIGVNATLSHEWRDKAAPYGKGPGITLSGIENSMPMARLGH